MAVATRHHSIVNPARGNRARRNKRKRHLSAKQVKYFGSPAQKAALKRKRRAAAKHNRPKHRARTRNVARPRYNPKPRKNTRRASNRKRAKASKKRHATRRTNPGEILSLTLGNPASKRRSMAAHHKKARRSASNRTNRRHHRKNAGRRMNRHHRHHHRRNAGAGMNVTNLFTEGLSALVGMAGSRLLTQAVLGASNTGAYGYAGNAAATAVLAGVAHMMFKNKPAVRDGIIIGGAAGILARAMTDYTPFGSYLTQAGFQGYGCGDYSAGGASGLGLYIPSNDVVPARYIGSSRQVEIPAGWAPTVVAPAAATKAGMGTYGRSRYGRY